MNQKKYIQLLLLLLLPQRFPTRKQPRKQSFCPYSSYILSHFGRNTNSSISVYLLFDERGRFPATRHVRMTNPSHDSSLNFLRQIRARSTSSPFPLLPFSHPTLLLLFLLLFHFFHPLSSPGWKTTRPDWNAIMINGSSLRSGQRCREWAPAIT